MEIIQVQPRDFYLHYVYVPTKETIIKWTFTTRKNNIAFGLYRQTSQSSLTPLPHTYSTKKRGNKKKAVNKNNNTEKHIFIYFYIDTNIAHKRSRSKLLASEKLREMNEWTELIPIEQVNSVKTKVEGSYTVESPGHYILVFGTYFVGSGNFLTHS